MQNVSRGEMLGCDAPFYMSLDKAASQISPGREAPRVQQRVANERDENKKDIRKQEMEGKKRRKKPFGQGTANSRTFKKQAIKQATEEKQCHWKLALEVSTGFAARQGRT